MIVSFLKKIVKNETFFPTGLGVFTNPFYFARKGLATNIMELGGNVTGKVLDVGCGTKPYEKVYNASEYIGLEYDTPHNREKKDAEYFYTGEQFPFEDSVFDSAVASQVFEHVFNPDGFLIEISRVLKSNGIFLITVPFVWDEHEQPYDFARYTSFGLVAMLEKHGFEIIEKRKSINDVQVIFQLINAYIYKITAGKNQFLNLLWTIILMAPFNLLGLLFSLLLPKNDDLYLDNIIVAKKVT